MGSASSEKKTLFLVESSLLAPNILAERERVEQLRSPKSVRAAVCVPPAIPYRLECVYKFCTQPASLPGPVHTHTERPWHTQSRDEQAICPSEHGHLTGLFGSLSGAMFIGRQAEKSSVEHWNNNRTKQLSRECSEKQSSRIWCTQ